MERELLRLIGCFYLPIMKMILFTLIRISLDCEGVVRLASSVSHVNKKMLSNGNLMDEVSTTTTKLFSFSPNGSNYETKQKMKNSSFPNFRDIEKIVICSWPNEPGTKIHGQIQDPKE